MANMTSKELAGFIDNDMNVLISGPHGVGKSAIAKAAVAQLGYKCAMFTGSTMDPYLDLVGIPKTVEKDGRDNLELIRPRKVDEAEVVFIDEFNRMDDARGQNAFLEMALEHSINGEHLPNLKSVIVCINPPNDDGTKHQYQVNDLDPAMVDRFDVFETLEPEVSVSLFVQLGFTRQVATVLAKWWKTNNGVGDQYISPRRLEKIGKNYIKFPSLSTLNRSVPPSGKFATGELHKALMPLVNPEEAQRRAEAEAAKAAKRQTNVVADSAKFATSLRSAKPHVLRQAKGREKAISFITDSSVPQSTKSEIASAYAKACANDVGPENMVRKFGAIVNEMSSSDLAAMVNRWQQQKRSNFGRELNNSRGGHGHKMTDDTINRFIGVL